MLEGLMGLFGGSPIGLVIAGAGALYALQRTGMIGDAGDGAVPDKDAASDYWIATSVLAQSRQHFDAFAAGAVTAMRNGQQSQAIQAISAAHQHLKILTQGLSGLTPAAAGQQRTGVTARQAQLAQLIRTYELKFSVRFGAAQGAK